MRVTVVYECMFGNTHAVAEAIAAGARDAGPGAEVVLRPAWDAPHAGLAGTGLLIAGGPTRAPGFSQWLEGLPAARDGSLGAAFDTRDGYRLAGGAAHDIGHSLELSGYGRVARPEGFVVWGTEGPLRAGERQRAGAGARRSWSPPWAGCRRSGRRTNDSAPPVCPRGRLAKGVSWMDVAIVYESLFGNTRSVAEAIADGVRQADPSAHVDLLPVADAKAEQVARAQLLVVGGPTHMRGLTSDMTRRKGLESEEQAARDKGRAFAPEAGAAGPGIRDWFGALPKAAPGAHAAAFDTRAGFTLAGGAAKKISQRLRRHGYGLVGKPAGFIIEGTEGPLRDGERDKARAWGAALVGTLGPSR